MLLIKDHSTVNFSFAQLKETQHIKGMSYAYPKYEFFLQSPGILFGKYGIPKINKYNKTYEDRTYINLP